MSLLYKNYRATHTRHHHQASLIMLGFKVNEFSDVKYLVMPDTAVLDVVKDGNNIRIATPRIKGVVLNISDTGRDTFWNGIQQRAGLIGLEGASVVTGILEFPEYLTTMSGRSYKADSNHLQKPRFFVTSVWDKYQRELLRAPYHNREIEVGGFELSVVHSVTSVVGFNQG